MEILLIFLILIFGYFFNSLLQDHIRIWKSPQYRDLYVLILNAIFSVIPFFVVLLSTSALLYKVSKNFASPSEAINVVSIGMILGTVLLSLLHIIRKTKPVDEEEYLSYYTV